MSGSGRRPQRLCLVGVLKIVVACLLHRAPYVRAETRAIKLAFEAAVREMECPDNVFPIRRTRCVRRKAWSGVGVLHICFFGDRNREACTSCLQRAVKYNIMAGYVFDCLRAALCLRVRYQSIRAVVVP